MNHKVLGFTRSFTPRDFNQGTSSRPPYANIVIRLGTIAVSALMVASCNHHYDINIPPFQPYDVPNSVVIADLNGDGKNDLAVAYTHIDGGYPNLGYASVILQSSTSPGTFQTGVDTPLIHTVDKPVGSNPSIIAVGDLDGANGLDLVTANSSANNVSVLLQGTTPGQYPFATSYSINSTSSIPNDVAIGDLNGDGLADLAVADVSSNGNVAVLFQDPAHHGQFLAPVMLAVGNPASSVAVGDVNGDNLPDIVVTSYDVSGNNGQVSVFIQNPASHGTFLPRVDYAAGAMPAAVKIADVNGDTFPDLIIANQGPGHDGMGSSGVSVLLQSATSVGTFLAPTTYATAHGAISVAVGDLNNDGKPDLVVANLGGSRTGSVSVLLQNPAQAGVFMTATNYPGVYGPLSVAIGDLNGDGKPDIAVADGNRATIMFQSSTTAGTFATPVMVGN